MKIMFFVICLFVELCFSQQNINTKDVDTIKTVGVTVTQTNFLDTISPCDNPRLAFLKSRNDSCSLIMQYVNCLDHNEWNEYNNLLDKCKKSQKEIHMPSSSGKDWSKEIKEETVIIPCEKFAILRTRNDSCYNNNLTTCLNGDEWKEYRRLQDECEKSQSVIMQKAAAQQELSGNPYSGVFNQLGNWHIFWGVIGCASSACGFFSIAHNKGNSWLYVLDIGYYAYLSGKLI
jgi:hypothetical protein